MLSFLREVLEENPVHRLALKTSAVFALTLGFLLGLTDYATVYEGNLVGPLASGMLYLLAFGILAWAVYPLLKGASELICSDHGRISIVFSTLLGLLASLLTLLAAVFVSFQGLYTSNRDLFTALWGSAGVSSFIALSVLTLLFLWKLDRVSFKINFHLIVAFTVVLVSAPAAIAGSQLDLVETRESGGMSDGTGFLEAPEIRFVNAYRNNDGTINLTVRSQQDTVFNTTSQLELYFYPVDLGPSSAIEYEPNESFENIVFGPEPSTCFQEGHEKSGSESLITPGATFECDTNVEWPSSPVGFQIRSENTSEVWNYTCDPSRNEETC
jgi:hypothetical protein